MGVELEIVPGKVEGRRSRSIPTSLEDGGRTQIPSGGIELKIYESKSCEALRKHRVQYCAKLSREMLYREALYTGTHMLGKPSTRFPSSQEDILTYVQVTFARDVQEQVDFIQQVTAEPFPLTIVNVGIRRAESLISRDKSGLSDPYCLISVETEESMDKSTWKNIDVGSPQKPKGVKTPRGRERPMAEKRFDQIYQSVPKSIRTTIQHQTLNPIWEERFQCLALRPSHDILHIEVWDHDDEQDVVNSLHAATNRRQTARLEEGTDILQEGFQNNASGKHDDFIGKATNKISEIPVEGEERWFYLHGKTHRSAEAQGKILIQIWLTHSYRHGCQFQPEASPRMVLEKLWDHILEAEARNWKGFGGGDVWDGEIPVAATSLLFQYGLQTGMSESTQAIIRFNAYAKRHIHGMHGTEQRLKELDTSMGNFKGLSQESAPGKGGHCDTTEVLESLIKSLQGPFSVLRNHLRERQEAVEEALKAWRHVTHILSRIGAQEQLANMETELKTSLRVGIQEWYQGVYKDHVSGPPGQTGTQVVCALVQVVGLVNRKLGEGVKVWRRIFSMESNLEYLPLLYDELQKGIVKDVEGTTWTLLQNIGDNDVQRKILLRLSPEHKLLCRCLFELYAQTHAFVQFQPEVFSGTVGRQKFYDHLDKFHEWFRPVLVLWLGFAFVRAHQMISNSINLDDVTAEGNQLTSHSAFETVLVFHQLASFAKELNWPDPAESSVVNMFLVEVMTYVSILFAKLKRKKIDKEGYFDTVDQFDISERLCTSLNNIQYIQKTVQSLPRELWIDDLLKGLGDTVGVGSEALRNCHSRIVNSLVTAVNHIEMEIQEILAGIAHRIRPEIRAGWEEVLILLDENADDHLEPLLIYLETNLRILHQYLFHENFVRMLQVFWMVICQELRHAVTVLGLRASSTAEQSFQFQKLQSLLPILIDYLRGNGEGLQESHLDLVQFREVTKLLHLFTLPTEQLLRGYFLERATEQLELKGEGHLGSLQVRVSVSGRKLNVEMISAHKLLAFDQPSPIWDICRKARHPTSDPRVELDLILQGQSVDETLRKTETQSRTLNPTFGEAFEFVLDKEVLMSTVIRFTVKDVDLLSSNDFMGEAFVPVARMPGLAPEKPFPQPMNLQLRATDDEVTSLFLNVLNSRTWEDEAKGFVSEQLKKTPVPVRTSTS